MGETGCVIDEECAMKKTGYDAVGTISPNSAGLAGTVDRRREARFAFTAAITALDPGTGAHIEARTTDIASGGCYVDVMNPFPAGSFLQIRLKKDGQFFETQARVTYCQSGVGMGLEFTDPDPKQIQVVKGWLAEARGDSIAPHYNLDQIERDSTGSDTRTYERQAIEELLLVMMRKGILTEDEGEAILKRLIR
jgi:PilZ domain